MPNTSQLQNGRFALYAAASAKWIAAIVVALGCLSSMHGQAPPNMSTPYGSLTTPVGVAVDSSGNVYIADSGAGVVYEEDVAMGTTTTIAPSGMSSAWGVAVDASGTVYITDNSNNEIWKVPASGSAIAISGSFSSPTGLALDSSGTYLYVADTVHNVVKKVLTTSPYTVTTVAGGGTSSCPGDGGVATSACLSNPVGVALDSSGNLYIADRDDYRVRKVDSSTGIINTIAGNGSAPPTAGSIYANGVALDSGGDVFILGGTQVYEVPAGGSLATYACNSTSGYRDGPITGSSSVICLMAGGTVQGGSFDQYGNFFLADPGNNAVREIPYAGGGTYCPTTTLSLSQAHVTGSSSVTNAAGPLTSSGGDVNIYVEKDTTASPNLAYVTYSGFPACIAQNAMTLTFDDLSLGVWNDPYDIGGAYATVLYNGSALGGFTDQTITGPPYTVNIPAGTKVGMILVRTGAFNCHSVLHPACGAEASVGYIHIN